MAQQTSVELLIQQIENKNGKEFSSYYQEFVEQAKEMEKEQSEKYAEFCVKCDRGGMKLLDFNDYIKL